MSTPPFIEHADEEERRNTGRQNGTGPPMVFDEDKRIMVPALDFAQRELKLPQLKRLINYSAEKPRFAIELEDGRRLPVGGTAKLRNPLVITDLIADATDEYPPAMTPAKFRPVATALRLIAELEDADASPKAETRSWIAQFVRENLGNEGLDLNGADRAKVTKKKGACSYFTTADHHVYLHAPSLLKHIRVGRTAQVALPELTERLDNLDFTKETIVAPRGEDGSQRQRKYWRSPDGYDWEAE